MKVLKILVLAGLMAGFPVGNPAQAQVSDDILTPFRAYRAALDSGDKTLAVKEAKKAYEAAETILGDHKTTGDLAQNYADAIEAGGNVRSSFRKEHIELYIRSAELAKFYDDDSAEIAVQRYLKAAAVDTLGSANTTGLRALKDAERLIKDAGLAGSTYDGEAHAHRSNALSAAGKKQSALEKIEESIKILDMADDGIATVYPYIARLHKAHLLKTNKDKLPAALEYQAVMQSVEGKVSAEHPFVKASFGNWIFLRSELEKDGRLEEAEKAGLCECWPYDDYKNKLMPILRTPPTMPSKAMRSGSVFVKFDVDDNGATLNPEIIRSSEALFEKSALKSLEQWVYSPRGEDEPDEARKGIISTIRYKLMDERGNVIPERSPN